MARKENTKGEIGYIEKKLGLYSGYVNMYSIRLEQVWNISNLYFVQLKKNWKAWQAEVIPAKIHLISLKSKSYDFKKKYQYATVEVKLNDPPPAFW